MTQRLKNYYYKTIIPKLISIREFKYKNSYEAPSVKKIVVNRGIGDASQNNKILESSLKEFSLIAGQKAVITRSKTSIAGFKIRKYMPVGISLTLRGRYMYGFLDRLINLALPRIRDFQGLSVKSFDGNGNYSLGVEEQLMFPEINYDTIHQLSGLDITIVTTAKTDQESFYLLNYLGLPFYNKL